MKRCTALLLSLLLMLSAIVPTFGASASTAAKDKPRVAFGDDGKFTILQIADIQGGANLFYLCRRSILYAVQKAKPDLIVLTGDNFAGYNARSRERSRRAIAQFMDMFESIGVPVAAVFGNHDDDKTPYTKLEQIEQYESYSCYIGSAGVVAEREKDGVKIVNAGTYNIPVYAGADSDDVLFNIWCFDSGNNINPDPGFGGYGYVLSEQVDWYVKTSDALRKANGGKAVPSCVFQHIIPPQIYRTLREVKKGTRGALKGGDKYYTLPEGLDPKTNWMGELPSSPNTACKNAYAELDAMVAQGDVKAVFVGHDHVNCYSIPYKGIDLVNTPACTFQAYNDLNRGFRVITVDKAHPDTYDTYTLYTKDLLFGSGTADVIPYAFRFVYDCGETAYLKGKNWLEAAF
ncbi:MAG: metallophosphoesterase [Clostridia bacterium]|nr:metallophosphoesterase [Clostridia bacterium]